MIRLHAISPWGGEETEVVLEGPEELSLLKILAARLISLDYEVTVEDSEGDMIPLEDFEEFEE